MDLLKGVLGTMTEIELEREADKLLENAKSISDLEGLSMTDEEIEQMWDELEDVLFVEAQNFFDDPCYTGDLTLVLASNWKFFEAGTTRRTIWNWFNRYHSQGLSYLCGK